MLKKRERLRLVVIGGLGCGEVLNSLERYDPSTNEWEEEAVAPMPTPRRYVGTAVIDGKVYAVSGWAPTVGFSPSVERYDLATKLERRSVGGGHGARAPMVTARLNFGVVSLRG